MATVAKEFIAKSFIKVAKSRICVKSCPKCVSDRLLSHVILHVLRFPGRNVEFRERLRGFVNACPH